MIDASEQLDYSKSEKLSKLFLENTEDLIFIVKENNQIEYINENVHKQLTGYSIKDLFGKSIVDFTYTKDRKKIEKFFEDIFKMGKASAEIRILKKNGSFIFLNTKGIIFISEERKKKIVLISREIDESKIKKEKFQENEYKFKELCDNLTEIRFWKLLQPRQCMAALQESQQVLNTVVDIIPQYILWKDTNSYYLGCNNNFARLLGLENSLDIMGKTDYDLELFKETADNFREKEKAVMETNNPEIRVVENLIGSEGEKIWFEVNRIPLHDLEEEVTGILITYDDISDRKKAENALQESEKKYRDLAELLPEVIFEYDLNGNLTYVNSKGLELFKYTPEDLKNGLKVVQMLIPEELERVKQNLESVKKGVPLPQSEYKFKKKDDSIFYGIAHSRLIQKDGKIIGNRGILIDITERKLAEEKLKESEEKFRTIAEQSLMGICIIQNNTLKYVNQRVTDISGFTFGELNNWKFTDLLKAIHPADQTIVKEQVAKKQANANTLISHYQVRAFKKTRELMWLDIHSKTIPYEGKLAILAVIFDITEKVENEKKLQKSEEKYRHLFESSPFAIWLVDLKGKIIDCNSTMNKLAAKHTRNDLIGKNFTEVTSLMDNPEKELSLFKPRFLKLIKGEPIEPIEHHYKRADGKELWVILHSSLIKFDNETLIQVIINDITEKKVTELKIKESEEKFRHLFEGSPIMIVLVNLEGKIVDLNSSSVKKTGYTKDELIGKHFTEFSKILSINFSEIIEKQKRLFKEGNLEPFQFRATKKDGNSIWIELQASLVNIDHQNFIQVIMEDITAQKLAENALIQLNKDLEQKVDDRTKELRESENKLKEQNEELKKLDKAKNEFITMIAHELKTPLIPITGYSEYMLMKYKENIDSEIQEDLQIINRNVKRLRDFIDQLLEVMRIDENRLKLKKENVNINNIIKVCVEELSYQIKERNHSLNIKIDDGIVLNVDSTRISHIFTNLISNAIKFSPDNGKIEITCKREETQYLFEVKDNGIGLEKNEIDCLFKKFEIIKRDKEDYYGYSTGLGLYITKEIIEMHGGKIWATSEGRNKGTTFHFTIPI